MRALPAAALVLFLAACSSSGGSSSPSVSPPAPVETAFLSVVHKVEPDAPDDASIRYARGVCSELRSGVSWVAEIASAVRVLHIGGYKAGELIGASIGAFCPDQESKVP